MITPNYMKKAHEGPGVVLSIDFIEVYKQYDEKDRTDWKYDISKNKLSKNRFLEERKKSESVRLKKIEQTEQEHGCPEDWSDIQNSIHFHPSSICSWVKYSLKLI